MYQIKFWCWGAYSAPQMIWGNAVSSPVPKLNLLHLASPSLPLEVGPLNPGRCLGNAVRSGFWGRAPAKIEFGTF